MSPKATSRKRQSTPKKITISKALSPLVSRVVIEGVFPEVEAGHFPIKRIVGDDVVVEADIFSDGHDVLSAVLLVQREGASEWREVPMTFMVNDRWRGVFSVVELGRYRYTLEAWVDHFRTWHRNLQKKIEANQEVSLDLLVGADLVERASKRASGEGAKQLKAFARILRSDKDPIRVQLALSDELMQWVERYPDRSQRVRYAKELSVVVDREKARFSSWYELFPRSCGNKKQYGTFRDCEAQLPDIAEMGFDVLYLPPIHPIGKTHRKGKNNATKCTPEDPGSPWAIGGPEGGHKAIHPSLGTLEEFRHLVEQAKALGIEVALDLAYQCSPDHPYVQEHPEWFVWRPDGTVQYAENPPKKYQDIYPINFETSDWEALWEELKSIVLFWVDQGIRIFRVDNPHTKPFAFWEWLIREVKAEYPEVIFLAEAFTRPKVMYRLAALGFTQSYTYFAWRNTKWDLMQYFTELTQDPVRDFFRPNLWPNTPDILTEYLQWGGRPAFMNRLVLAATLGANYGIYGPAFELCENRPTEPGKEEYLNAEKYEIKSWNPKQTDNIRDLVMRLNRIRKDNLALQTDRTLRFHSIDNDQLICYSKATEDQTNVIIVVVNVDYHNLQSGWLELPLQELGVDSTQPYQVHDLLSDAKYVWQGSRNYISLNPHVMPAHIFRVRHHLKTEHQFDYFL